MACENEKAASIEIHKRLLGAGKIPVIDTCGKAGYFIPWDDWAPNDIIRLRNTQGVPLSYPGLPFVMLISDRQQDEFSVNRWISDNPTFPVVNIDHFAAAYQGAPHIMSWNAVMQQIKRSWSEWNRRVEMVKKAVRAQAQEELRAEQASMKAQNTVDDPRLTPAGYAGPQGVRVERGSIHPDTSVGGVAGESLDQTIERVMVHFMQHIPRVIRDAVQKSR